MPGTAIASAGFTASRVGAPSDAAPSDAALDDMVFDDTALDDTARGCAVALHAVTAARSAGTLLPQTWRTFALSIFR
ncbi:hypothetical protein [Arthrobacter polaris]|uniref:hypothetical protein n=1 Tax=Arthrobacter polaris TaxID=2813727 RepID=UPI001F33024A|nr:hypothetical protein [Arthrobacter polaris]UIK90805.1 hypothetical protein J0916_03855 [Arthrobacter polaris]